MLPRVRVLAYFHRSTGRGEERSCGKLVNGEDDIYLLNIDDPNASAPVTYKGF